ncbi:MAG: response regulator [Pseudomonadales bacterium]|nr:response regulator [Pseudomonadales bacterium]
MTLDKLARDRKILRKIDLNIAIHGRYVALTYLAIYIAIAATGGLYREHTALCLAFGGLLMFTASLVVFFSVRFDQIHGSGPNKWRRHFVLVHWTSKFSWGLFAAYITFEYGLTTNTFLVVLITVCTGAISNVEWSPFHRANYIAQSILFVPLVVSLMLLQNVNGFVVGSIVLVVYALLMRQSNVLSRRHWNSEKDSHELKIQTRDLAQAVKEAHSASQVKAEFLANVTHEIRTPMNNVLGMLALLDDTELSNQQKQLQNVAVHSGEALLRLIDDVLDYSKIASGSIYFNENVFSLRRCLNQCLELLGPLAHSKGIEVSVIYERDIPIRIKSDEDRLAQVITNLVSNAIRYSDGSEVIVRASLNKQGNGQGALRIDVIDDGVGFDSESKEALFEAFAKNSAEVGNVQEGSTGLGLAIVRGLVESQGGEIGFESALNQGSRFWFTMKVGVSTQQAQIDYKVKPLIGRNALLVDGTQGLIDALTAEMADIEINTVAIQGADNVIDELHLARKEERDYALVMINCPIREHINFDLIRSIQADAQLKNIKILMLASLAQRTQYQRELEKYTRVEWLTKPVTRIGLANSLSRLYDLAVKDPAAISEMDSPANAEDGTKTILLVEDNKVNQMVARGMLNKLGYTVSMASNGKEALSILEDRQFDLILMDCLMPEMDGYEATSAIRAKEKLLGTHVPILAMTASVIEGEETRCLSAGMDDYLAKPVNIDDLGAKIRVWLEGENNQNKEEGVVHTGKQLEDNAGQQRRLA